MGGCTIFASKLCKSLFTCHGVNKKILLYFFETRRNNLIHATSLYRLSANYSPIVCASEFLLDGVRSFLGLFDLLSRSSVGK